MDGFRLFIVSTCQTLQYFRKKSCNDGICPRYQILFKSGTITDRVEWRWWSIVEKFYDTKQLGRMIALSKWLHAASSTSYKTVPGQSVSLWCCGLYSAVDIAHPLCNKDQELWTWGVSCPLWTRLRWLGSSWWSLSRLFDHYLLKLAVLTHWKRLCLA